MHIAENDAKLHNIDFLAARSLVGNQDIIPVAVAKPARLRKFSYSDKDSKGTHSTISHSQSNSLSQAMSRTHSRGHSRGDSFGRSALKIAKGICGVDDAVATPPADDRYAGLEGALRNEKTKVIRLADPAQVTADHSDNAGTSGRRPLASPAPSGISESMVGIALSTPPLTVEEGLDRESIRLPGHPFAQGGLYSYNPVALDLPEKAADYAGPHPASRMVAADSVRSDVSQRHRLPPQALHPYAQTSARDSYQSFVPQLRPDSNVPAHSKMWAQFSPGVVREVLPHEIGQYSPFLPHSGSPVSGYSPKIESTAIIDTIGVGEALAYAMQNRSSKDSGLGTSEGHTISPITDNSLETNTNATSELSRSSSYQVHRKPVHYDSATSYLHPTQKLLSQHLLPSKLDTIYSADSHLTAPSPSPHHSNTSSPGPPPSSSPESQHPLENSDDFRDLFVKPTFPGGSSAVSVDSKARPTISRNASNSPWDVSSSDLRRTNSELTSLARHFSAEYEALEQNAEYEQTVHANSSSSSAIASRAMYPTRLRFVLSENPESTSLIDAPVESAPVPRDALPAFHPSVSLPRDVESSRASSVMERSPLEDPTGKDLAVFDVRDADLATEAFRMGVVESASTPPATSSDHRRSYTGQMAFVSGGEQFVEQDDDQTVTLRRNGIVSSSNTLPLPSADPTRSSYLTSSSFSRMSTLSDFPAPPPRTDITPAHMSLLNSYFGDASVHIAEEPRSNDHEFAGQPNLDSSHRDSPRLTFGGDDDIEELLANLSDHGHYTSDHGHR